MVIEEHGNSRNFYSTMLSDNGKVDTMFHSMMCQWSTSKFALKEEAHHMLHVQMKRSKKTIMLQRNVKMLKTKNPTSN